ncbi:hypothetical protein [uncultured Mailhella sp.]|uniref:hypothetical protein n=1 Tax=uncultured Mailhella sp. TaxID=1981031 RepID=UPI00261A4835|nr:hypothetical protein [uncultured Mailhella sp.]
MKFFIFILLLQFIIPTPAYAYLDPGTGSMLLSAMIGILATLLFFIKSIWYQGIGFFYTLAGKTHHREHTSLAFYCEGKQYWNTFKPVLAALSEKGEPCTYLTSDEED